MSGVSTALTPAASASARPQVQFAHAFFDGAHAVPAYAFVSIWLGGMQLESGVQLVPNSKPLSRG